MKMIVVTLVAVGMMSAAPAKKAVKKPVPAAKVVPETRIPADATPTEDGGFRYTDASGKKWLYRNTPFGVSKVEDKPVVQVTQGLDNSIRATEDGDNVRFEKTSPFGVTKWQKKKTALTSDEQAVLDRQKTAGVPAK